MDHYSIVVSTVPFCMDLVVPARGEETLSGVQAACSKMSEFAWPIFRKESEGHFHFTVVNLPRTALRRLLDAVPAHVSKLYFVLDHEKERNVSLVVYPIQFGPCVDIVSLEDALCHHSTKDAI